MAQEIFFSVNKQPIRLMVEADELLIDTLRERLRLTGTKKGCGGGECGACTVLVDGRPISSCLTLVMKVAGSSVLTVEGLGAEGELHVVQRAFIKHGAAQCGFCTAGMLLSAVALLEGDSPPSLSEIKSAIAGNLCRCSGYVKIVAAIAAASRDLAEEALPQ